MRILFVLFALLLTLVSVSAIGEVFDGDTVYINDSRAYISATPHTISGSGWVENTILSKSYSGNVNWVMLTSEITGEYFKPTQLQYYDDTMIDVTYYDADNVSFIVREERGWTDIPKSFSKNNVQVVGKNRAYAITNIPVTAGVPVRFRYYVKQTWYPPMFSSWDAPLGFDGKYDIAVYPSAYGANVKQAFDDGNLYLLDPYVELNDGLLNVWTFDNTLLTAIIDEGSQSQVLTTVNNPLLETGLVGDGIRFDGSTNYLNTPDALTVHDWVASSERSISLLFKRDRNDTNEVLIGYYRGGGQSYTVYEILENNTLKFHSRNGGGTIYTTFSNVTVGEIGEWYHVVFTIEGSTSATSTAKIYINGIDSGTGKASEITTYQRTEYIGALHADTDYADFPASFFDGMIDEFYIYDSVLSASDISLLYSELSQGYGYPFSERVNISSVDILLDSSYNANESFFYSANVSPSNASIDSYSWDFGNGFTSNTSNGTTSYSSTGMFTVSLNVTDANNNTVSDSMSVFILAPSSGTTGNTTTVSGPFEFEESTFAFIIGILIVVCALWMGLRFHPVFFSFAGLTVGALTFFGSGTLFTESVITFLLYAFSVMLLLTGFVASMFKK